MNSVQTQSTPRLFSNRTILKKGFKRLVTIFISGEAGYNYIINEAQSGGE